MQISPGIQIVDLALYLKRENILIISDTHIGYEESLNRQGVLIPRFQFKETIKRLNKVFEALSVNRGGGACEGKWLNKIIINGDIKHEFGTISEQEWRHTLRLIDYLKKYSKEIILIKGNHDKTLGPIAEKRGVKVKDYMIISDMLIIHGDRLDNNIQKLIKKHRIKKIIIGHEHPAISLREGLRVENYKCFLKGKWKRKTLIVQPSFNLVTEGTDVTKEALLIPFLTDLTNFDVYIVSDKVYEFGKIKNLSTKI